MKRLLTLLMAALFLVACGSDDAKEEETTPVSKEETAEKAEEKEAETEESTEEEAKEEKPDMKTEAEANAEENSAKPGAMLFDKNEEKFKGMNYHFKGELIGVETVEGLFGMEDALLVKNEQGYVMPVFLPYEVTANVGDEIEVWGPLSGDGYASSDLDVDNVVGIAGAMNASLINVNGEQQ